MNEEILINVTPREVRAALVEDHILQEIHIERSLDKGLSGNIYQGKVRRLMPGIQAAFVDIGLEQAAFLHASDIEPHKNIRDLITQDQEILVQVYKDPMGAKGARVTTQFTLPSRYLVFTPQSLRITVSQRITDEAVRERLLRMLAPSTQGGYIFRTAAVMASPAEIEADKEFLQALWTEILTRSRYAKTGELVYAELPLMLRVLRDWVTDEVTRVRVDQPRAAEEMKEFARQYMPKLVGRIEYHAPPQPIFDIDSIEEQLQKTLHRKVYLKSGGHLIFDQTEAMTTIDVNSGSYPGGGSHEETIFKINSEAVDVIAWQIRLRNLGGIIVVDFIDMMDPAHKEKLLELLTAAVAKDSVRTEVSELSTLGLVQMTRKRTRESLERILCAPCPLCKRRGSVKSLETMCYEILRELQQTARHFAWPGFQVIAAEPVVNYFLSQEPALLSDLERQIGKPMTLRVGPLYGQEQYDILPAS